jgi:hypothetical protein
MDMKSFSLSFFLLATVIANASGQEFIVAPSQVSNPPPCQQENCVNDPASASTSNSQSSSNQNPGSSNGSSGGQGVKIDRSGMDKASIHLQILQQTAPHFNETSPNKKSGSDDKKTNNKSQSSGETEGY